MITKISKDSYICDIKQELDIAQLQDDTLQNLKNIQNTLLDVYCDISTMVREMEEILKDDK
jgi:hypothetical protein